MCLLVLAVVSVWEIAMLYDVRREDAIVNPTMMPRKERAHNVGSASLI
jgi:hypothetical protein